ncbi:MAG: AAA family ATPase, partial [Chloroflexi bacterium]|nr:AAA family ATPase [Chloroflexota bacterium]
MRLSSVTLSRFKAFEAATFDIAPLTVLIGPNNAGKSSLLHALAVLAQSAQQGGFLRPQGPAVDLGRDAGSLTRSSSVARGHEVGWAVGIGWEAHPPEVSDLGIPELVITDFKAQLTDAGQAPETRVTAHIPIRSLHELTVSAGYPSTSKATLEYVDCDGVQGGSRTLMDATAYTAATPFSFDLQLPDRPAEPQVARGDVSEAVIRYAWLMAALHFRQVGKALQAFRYVGADRTVDQSVFSLGSGGSEDPRTAHQIADTLAYNRDLLRRVSDRCHRVFGYGIDIDLIPDRQVAVVATRQGDLRVNVVNMGSGLIQLIWIVLQLELARRQERSSQGTYVATVGIEEPELHLHPALQPQVAGILANFVQQESQVICTTQSEHFLMALLQMVLEGSLDSKALCVYYVESGQARKQAGGRRARSPIRRAARLLRGKRRAAPAEAPTPDASCMMSCSTRTSISGRLRQSVLGIRSISDLPVSSALSNAIIAGSSLAMWSAPIGSSSQGGNVEGV